MEHYMYIISRWAKLHRELSRILIVSGHFLLMFIAWQSGSMLHDLGFVLMPYWITGCSICIGILFIFYPGKSNSSKGNRISQYACQKRFDLGLLSLGFFMFFLICNRDFVDVLTIPGLGAVNRSTDMMSSQMDSCSMRELPSMKSFYESKDMSQFNSKEKRQYVKSQVKQLKQNHRTSNDAKALLVLLAILAGVGIIFLAAAISCSLACSGSGAAAGLVMVFGVVLGVMATISMIRAITKSKKLKPETHSNHDLSAAN